jgi:hypothetical protein
MVEGHNGLFEVNITTGQMFVPEGACAKLDYEGVQSYVVEVAVKDRCEAGCYPGKLAEECCGNICLYFQKIILRHTLIGGRKIKTNYVQYI